MVTFSPLVKRFVSNILLHKILLSTNISDIDDCSPFPCDHFTLCNDEIDAFDCVCSAGYEGYRCENGTQYVDT